VVEGRLAVGRLLTSGYTARSLLVDDHQLTSASELVATTQAQGVTVFVAPREVLAATVGFNLHRGVVAIANRPTPADPGELLANVAATSAPADTLPRIAVLEGLNDHENIGALFRNAAAFGVGCVLLDPSCADPLYRRAIRVSVGHVLHVPYARFAEWPSGLDLLRDAGFVIAALAPRLPSDIAVPAVSLSKLASGSVGFGQCTGVALLLGAEGSGLSHAAVAASDVVINIPMAEGVDSLNVATAAAVAFHALAEPRGSL